MTTPVQSSRLRKMFRDIEIVEATEPATIIVTEDDLARGIPGDPRRCALALASRRTWGDSAHVWFLRTVAYLVFSDRNSRMRAERFRQPAETRDMIKIFDAAGTPQPGRYKLYPPAPSQTVRGSYERATRLRQKAKAEGRKVVHKRRGPLDTLSYKRAQAFMHAAA